MDESPLSLICKIIGIPKENNLAEHERVNNEW